VTKEKSGRSKAWKMACWMSFDAGTDIVCPPRIFSKGAFITVGDGSLAPQADSADKVNIEASILVMLFAPVPHHLRQYWKSNIEFVKASRKNHRRLQFSLRSLIRTGRVWLRPNSDLNDRLRGVSCHPAETARDRQLSSIWRLKAD
jgi:hypothetical protein